jgi:serine protease
MASALDAIKAATLELPEDVAAQRARFALVARPSQDPIALAAQVQSALSPAGVRVRALSPLDPLVLVAEFPRRILRSDDATAFAAAYALADEFDLSAAEPDLPTNFFPDDTPPADRKGPVEEGVEGFPPGCWTPAQLGIDPFWAPMQMRVPEAWAFSEHRQRPARGRGVVVAQLDTGITRHAELESVISAPGFDVLSDDADATDPLDDFGNPGHGTATASVLVSPETRVVTGTAPLATFMPIRAIQSVIQITQVSVAKGINWAVEHGAHVITMSLGGIPSFALERALRRAVAADVIVLAAAGNCVQFVVWPARYDECIAVAGTNAADRPWRGTCRGSAVDVSAPAENVLRATIAQGARHGGAETGQGQGTSFAVALTAGVAALWLAHHGRPNLIAEARARGETLQAMFARLLRATARRPDNWDPLEMGAGVVNARALLEADFDLGREGQTVPELADSRAVAAVTVKSLVAEAISPQAARDDELDWHRFGPELATAVLRSQLWAAAVDTNLRPEATEAAAPPPLVSDRLVDEVRNPMLRDWLRRNSGPEPELGRKGNAL